MKYDLHTHSIASDGSLSAEQLVGEAHAKGIHCLALTDHDTVAAVKQAQQAAQSVGMQLVPGVEISVTWEQQTIHILGLNIDPESQTLLEGLEQMQAFRRFRAQRIGTLLEQVGISGAYAAAAELAQGQLISRTHFAQFLIQAGHAKSMQQVFKRYLVKGKPGHVPGEWANLAEAIDWIKTAGGMAVIAHPARYKLSATKLRVLVEQFKNAGGVGFEVVSGSHTPGECLKMAEYAERYALLGSAGSDYHGANHPWRKLGEMPSMPDRLTPIWQHQDWPVFAGAVA